MPESALDPVDLRSDTVTRPDALMLEAMRSAPLGDDVFGDDPTAISLEARAAELLGKEAALFLPSGTMANAVAIGAQCRPGDEVLLERLAHSFNFECAGAARLWGVQAVPLDGERGVISLERLAGAVRPENIHLPRTGLVILEQTSNIAGGCVLPLEYLEAVGALCRERGLAFHIDGARIFNAAVASGVSVASYAACADTVMFCVSKGLGAPAGSLLVGTAPVIHTARRLRKLLGGGMRQVGVLAACGLHALEHNVERLADDHRRAKQLATRLVERVGDRIEIDAPETNMLFFRPLPVEGAPDLETLVREIARLGALVVPLPPRGIRVVFHRDVDDSGLERAEAAIIGAVEALGASRT